MAAKKPVFEEPQERHVDCAHMDCSKPSIARIKTRTGMANVCFKHYNQHFQEIAEETTERLGLKTPADCRKWIMENGLRIKKFSEAA